MAYIEEVTTESVINQEGELLSSQTTATKTRISRVEATQYTVFLHENNMNLIDLPAGELKLLLLLGCLVDFKGHVDMSPYLKKTLCEKLRFSKKTLSNQLTLLKKKKFICSKIESQIEVSPEYLYRGKLQKLPERKSNYREKLLQRDAVLLM
jgi:hypothetical protein